MRTLLQALSWAVIASLALAANGAGPPVQQQALRPETLAEPEGWAGPRFLDSDKEGRVFLLHAESLTVYALNRHGELKVFDKLEALASPDEPEPVLAAAMSRDGGRWLLQVFGQKPLRLFVQRKEKSLPALEYMLGAIGFAGDEPLITVAPLKLGQPMVLSTSEPAPMLQRLVSSQWKTLVEEILPFERGQDPLLAFRTPRQAVFAHGAEGSFWMAQRHAYRLRHYSSTGKLLFEIRAGEGKIELRERTTSEQERLEASTAAAGEQGVRFGQLSRQVAKKAIQAVATSRDGKLFWLVAPDATDGKGLALDRYDPTGKGQVERLLLELPSYDGRQSLALGNDGLFLANHQSGSGLWFASWEALEAADWRTLPDVELLSGS